MTTNLSDTDLIARVAAKLGWKKDYASDLTWGWDAGNIRLSPTKLPSTDACLALLDKMLDGFTETYRSIITRYDSGVIEVEILRIKPRKSWLIVHDSSRPRAILLALLEVE